MIKSKRSALLAFCVAIGLASAANAANYVFLTPAQVDEAIQALPPPPVDGSPQAKTEMDELKQIQDARTSADMIRATNDDQTKNVSIFTAAIGPAFDPKTLPATAKLFADIRAELPRLFIIASRRSRSFSKPPSSGPSSERPRGNLIRIGSTKRPLTRIS